MIYGLETQSLWLRLCSFFKSTPDSPLLQHLNLDEERTKFKLKL